MLGGVKTRKHAAQAHGQTTREHEVGNVVYLDATSAAGATPPLDAGYYQVRGDTGVAKGVSIATQVWTLKGMFVSS